MQLNEKGCMKKLTFISIVLLFLWSNLYSRPQYAMTSSYGTKCITCHVNNQGGGLRNPTGWLSRKDVSLINPKSVGLSGFYKIGRAHV